MVHELGLLGLQMVILLVFDISVLGVGYIYKKYQYGCIKMHNFLRQLSKMTFYCLNLKNSCLKLFFKQDLSLQKLF